MFLLVIHVVLFPTQHLCFDTQKFYWAYAASPVHILYGRSVQLKQRKDILRLSRAHTVILDGYFYSISILGCL